MTSPLYTWAKRWSISYDALADLRHLLGIDLPPLPEAQAGLSEAAVQSRRRLLAARRGGHLFRNNVGALLDERGIPIRYGLANDSPQVNRVLKSGDLIGWDREEVTPDMVGTHVAIFRSEECKPGDWTYTGTPREQAQLAWINLVIRDGGRAMFVNSEDQ